MDAVEKILLRQFERVRQAEVLFIWCVSLCVCVCMCACVCVCPRLKCMCMCRVGGDQVLQDSRKAEEASKRSNTPLTPEEVKMRLLLAAAAVEERVPTSESQPSQLSSPHAATAAGSQGVVEAALASREPGTRINNDNKNSSEFKLPMRRPRQR